MGEVGGALRAAAYPVGLLEALAPAGPACEGPLPVALIKAGQLSAAAVEEVAGDAAREAACLPAVPWTAVVAAPATLL